MQQGGIQSEVDESVKLWKLFNNWTVPFDFAERTIIVKKMCFAWAHCSVSLQYCQFDDCSGSLAEGYLLPQERNLLHHGSNPGVYD